MDTLDPTATPEKNVLILVGSPRRDGNSATLAAEVLAGARGAGLAAEICFLDDYIGQLLHDLRANAAPPPDRYEELFLDKFLPAQAVVFCTPVYWYGMSAQTKAFLDRSFAYYVASHPRHEEVLRRVQHKRLGLVVVSEETYPGVAMGITHQIQEYARYTHSAFLGVVHGAGNRRGEVARDPRDPMRAGRELGRRMFELPYSEYRVDTPRSTQVWGTAG